MDNGRLAHPVAHNHNHQHSGTLKHRRSDWQYHESGYLNFEVEKQS